MKIKNPNFISETMTGKDVMLAFDLESYKDLYVLVEKGLVKKYYQYYKPTEKLMEQFIPIGIEIIDTQRLNGYNLFYIKNIQEIFNCDRITAKIILNKYFDKTNFGYWKRSEKLDELLAEGETILTLKLKEDNNNDNDKR